MLVQKFSDDLRHRGCLLFAPHHSGSCDQLQKLVLLVCVRMRLVVMSLMDGMG